MDSKETVEKTTQNNSMFGMLFSAAKKASVVGIVYLAGYFNVSIAWFIGPLVLLVLRDEWRKSSDRRRTIAKTAALASEEDVVLARLNDLPAWVFFPDIERAEWLNRIIKQVWPNVNQYARSMIRDTIQPNLKKTLEAYKLNGFRFDRIILGTVPFRIGGVKVYDKNVSRNEIIMDLDIFYAGDCDITFHLAGMKGGIKDFQLHGMLRVIMKPLISTVPLIGGLQVFFLNNPDIDFDLVGVADVLDMPGLGDMLRRIVVETVASMMVLPNKFPIKLSDDVEVMELKASEPEGVLRVHVVEAKHLMKKDIGMLGKGKSDPYAVVTVGAQVFKTKVINNNVDPKWDYWCEFVILESNGQQLYIHLWDQDDATDDETLGRATIDISNIVKKGQDDMWISLEQVKHGMVHLRLSWLTLSNDYNDLKAALEETQLLRVTSMSTAILTIFVDSAKNLPQARSSSKPDPYAVLKVGKNTQQTNVIMRTIHPVWEQGFTFLVANPESDTLHLTITDQKTSNEIGQTSYSISNLSIKSNMEIHKEPFSLYKSGPESKIVWSMQLRILKTSAGEETEKPPFERNDSTVSTGSNTAVSESKEFINFEKSDIVPDESTEIIEKNTVCPTEVSTALNSGDGLHHRVTPVTSSSGESQLGRIQLTLRYSVQRQRLIIVVHKIANIPLKDPSNVPDPYVKLYLLPERSKDTKRKTIVVKDNCNPIYDESFEYILSQGELNTKQLEITVGTQKQLFYTSSNILGQVIIDFSQVNLTQPLTSWFDLNPEND